MRKLSKSHPERFQTMFWNREDELLGTTRPGAVSDGCISPDTAPLMPSQNHTKEQQDYFQNLNARFPFAELKPAADFSFVREPRLFKKQFFSCCLPALATPSIQNNWQYHKTRSDKEEKYQIACRDITPVIADCFIVPFDSR